MSIVENHTAQDGDGIWTWDTTTSWYCCVCSQEIGYDTSSRIGDPGTCPHCGSDDVASEEWDAPIMSLVEPMASQFRDDIADLPVSEELVTVFRHRTDAPPDIEAAILRALSPMATHPRSLPRIVVIDLLARRAYGFHEDEDVDLNLVRSLRP